MVSAMVLGVALALMVFYILGKTQRIIVEEKIFIIEGALEAKKAKNQESLTVNAAFQEKANLIQEIDNFVTTGINPIDLFLAISNKRPQDLVFERFLLNEVTDTSTPDGIKLYEFELSGFIKAGYDEAFQTIKLFGSQLAKDDYLKPVFRDLEVKKLTRETSMEKTMTFILVIKLEIS